MGATSHSDTFLRIVSNVYELEGKTQSGRDQGEKAQPGLAEKSYSAVLGAYCASLP